MLIDLGLTIEKPLVSEGAKPRKDVQNLRTQVLLGDGEAKELPMEGKFNLIITPKILKDHRVVVSAKLYVRRDSGFELIGEPRLVADDGKEVDVALPRDWDSERTYRITFKPKVQ